MKLKDAAAVLPIIINWEDGLPEGDDLQSSSWAVTPDEPDGLVVAADDRNTTQTSALISGGIVGRMYRLTNTIVTAGGMTDSRSVSVRIGATRVSA